jgi:hypothetical protein
VIGPSVSRIIPYLNIACPGIFAVSAAVKVGECADLRRSACGGRARWHPPQGRSLL